MEGNKYWKGILKAAEADRLMLCPLFTRTLFDAGSSIEAQKIRVRNFLPGDIFFALDDENRLQDIKNAIKLYPHLKPDIAKVISGLKEDRLFKNMTSERSKKLKRIVNKLNKLLSSKD